MDNIPLPRPSDSWLVIIDMQNIFVQQNQPWYSCTAQSVVPNILDLAHHWAGRTLLTRFVTGLRPEGSWKSYYESHPNVKLVDGSNSTEHDYNIIDELGHLIDKKGNNLLTMTTFGKWGTQLHGLQAMIPEKFPRIVLTGVATECCVLSTAIVAGDAGADVWLVKDACAAGQSDPHKASENQNAVFTWVQPAFNYLINLTSTAELIEKKGA
jgi:nicotinamidase-related amidase